MDLITAIRTRAPCRSLPVLRQIPAEASRYLREVGTDTTPHEGMVRCCLCGATEVLPTRTFRIVSNYDLAPDLNQVDILGVIVKGDITDTVLDRPITDIVCIDPRCHRLHSHRVDRSRSRKISSSEILPHMPSLISERTTDLLALLPRKSAPLG